MPELVIITPLQGVYSAAISIWAETTNLYYLMQYESVNSGPPASGVITGELYSWGEEALNTGPAIATIDGFTTRIRLDLALAEVLVTNTPAVAPSGTLLKTLTTFASEPESIQTPGVASAPSGTLLSTLQRMTPVPESIATLGPALTPTGTLV